MCRVAGTPPRILPPLALMLLAALQQHIKLFRDVSVILQSIKRYEKLECKLGIKPQISRHETKAPIKATCEEDMSCKTGFPEVVHSAVVSRSVHGGQPLLNGTE
ncbi:hypothetical protein WISP_26009 [Willisornis vidua]|uniref:Secreted protein n=1 Tax=Willisornis vidua TaxID=1566151 RepID=A0ABQ9DN24_9PASS|nr:hypothetical protein WISP_26009 [Willisornis vidua]